MALWKQPADGSANADLRSRRWRCVW